MSGVLATALTFALQGHTVADAVSVTPGGSCLDESRLEDAVVAWLERDRIADDLRVEVVGDDEGHVEFALLSGSRRFAAKRFTAVADCGELHDAVALAIVVAIDSAAEQRHVVPPPPPEPPPTPPRVAPAPTPSPVPIPTKRPATVDLGAAAGLVVVLGVVGPVAFGGELGVRAGLRRKLEFRGAAMAAVGPPIPLGGGDVQLTLLTAHVEACATPQRRRLRFAFCGGLMPGVMLVRGRGFELGSTSSASAWLSPSLGGAAALVLRRRVTLELGVRALVPVVAARPRTRNLERGDVASIRLARVGGVFSLLVGF